MTWWWCSVAKSCPTLATPIGFFHPWDFIGKNTGVCCHFLLQGNFSTQGWNPGLLHCKWILYHWATREAYHKDSVNSVQSLNGVWLCDSMNRSTPGLSVHHQLPESTQTHFHRVGDAIQPFHPLSSPSPPALNLFQHQGLFNWVSSSHEAAKVLEFKFFQRIPRTDLL